jgi:hypothetical protein
MITSIPPDNVEIGYRNSLYLLDSDDKTFFRQFEQRIACHTEEKRGHIVKAYLNSILMGLYGIMEGISGG